MQNSIKISIVFGTRPEIIRLEPVIKEILRRNNFSLTLIHTGQHYSYSLDTAILNELELPQINYNIDVGPGSEVQQTAKIMLKMEDIILVNRPDIIITWGDTTSTLGIAITAIKYHIPVAHLESGCRSYDLRMAEEYNRKLVDHCSSILFAFSEHAVKILNSEKVDGTIKFVGNPFFEVYQKWKSQIDINKTLLKFGLEKDNFALMSCHRAENVDSIDTLKKIVEMIDSVCNKYKVVYPIHPRTYKNLHSFNLYKKLKSKNLIIIEPNDYLPYLDVVALLESSKFNITDSGGRQLEAYYASKPCITIRKTTEWQETVDLGVNVLIDPQCENFSDEILRIIANIDNIKDKFKNIISPYKATKGTIEICDYIENYLLSNSKH